MTKENWFVHIKVLVLSSIFASIGNWINTIKSGNPVTPLGALPGMLLLFFITIVGLLIWDLIGKMTGGKNLPAIAYISLIAIIMTIPGVPGAEFVAASLAADVYLHDAGLVSQLLYFRSLWHLIVYFQSHFPHVGYNHEEEEHGENQIRQRRRVEHGHVALGVVT